MLSGGADIHMEMSCTLPSVVQEASGAILRLLAEAGADLNSICMECVTPLLYAVMAGNTLGVMVLLGRL